MLLDLVKQRAVADAEVLCGTAAVPAKCIERTLKHFDLGAVLYIANNRPYAGAGKRKIGVFVSRTLYSRSGDLFFDSFAAASGLRMMMVRVTKLRSSLTLPRQS